MFKVKLTFCSDVTTELLRVDLSHGGVNTQLSVRGKTSGAFQGAGTFQWSSAVRAVACIFIKAKLNDETIHGEPMLVGEAKSLAASLDYALTKQPGWILDMFGVSATGRCQAKRLFRVTNSHRKRPGPVCLSLNLHACPVHCVEIVVDGRTVTNPDELRTMVSEIQSYGPRNRSSTQQGIEVSSDSEPQPDTRSGVGHALIPGLSPLEREAA